jgi:hypothetical protein
MVAQQQCLHDYNHFAILMMQEIDQLAVELGVSLDSERDKYLHFVITCCMVPLPSECEKIFNEDDNMVYYYNHTD